MSSTKNHVDTLFLFLYTGVYEVQAQHSFTTFRTVHPIIKCSLLNVERGLRCYESLGLSEAASSDGLSSGIRLSEA